MNDTNVIPIGAARPVPASTAIDIKRAIIADQLTALILDETPEGKARCADLRAKDAELAKLHRDALRREARDFDNNDELRELAHEQQATDDAALDAKIDAFIEAENYHYVRASDCLWYRTKESDDWETANKSVLEVEFPATADRKVRRRFYERLDALDRTFIKTVCSFRPQPPRVLNLTSTETFVQPINEPHHWLFDVLIHSIGGGKPENIEHIKKLLLAKWQHPENYNLPALVITDPGGGAGKNLLVETLVKGLFGAKLVAGNVLMKDLTGDFSGIKRGMAVVLINEAAKDETNFNHVKSIVGSATVVYNEKYVKKFEAENTPLYIIVGNARGCVIRITDSRVDRRWSIVKTAGAIEPYLNAFVANELGRPVTDDEVSVWLKTVGEHILKDRTEVARWLNTQIAEFGDIASLPPLHGADYREAVAASKPVHVLCFEAIFQKESFNEIGSIKRRTVRAFYDLIIERDKHGKFALGLQAFYAELDEWLKEHRPDIIMSTVKLKPHRTNTTVLHLPHVKRHETDNDWNGNADWWKVDIE